MYTFPVFGLVGMRDKPMRPLAMEDLVRILQAALVEGRLSRQTVAVTGPEEMPLGEALRRVPRVVGKRPLFFRMPVALHCLLAWCLERVMKIPLVSLAQLHILSEGIVEPLPACERLPDDLRPQTFFTDEQIRKGLPEAGAFGLKDLRWFA